MVLVDGALTPLRRARRPHPPHLVRRRWPALGPAALALSEAGRRGALGRMTVEKADGEQILGGGSTPLREALDAAGFVSTPRGLRLRGAMPEGDTVWRAARLTRPGADREGAGPHRLPGAGVRHLGPVRRHGRPRPSRAASTCSPASTATSPWTLHTHLKMEGGWRVLRPGQAWPRPGAHRSGRARDGRHVVAVGFQLGIVEIVPRDHEPDLVGHLGPDLLGPDWDADEAVRRLREHPDRHGQGGPPRPDPPGRRRQHVRLRALLHLRRRRRRRPSSGCPTSRGWSPAPTSCSS